MSRRTVPTTQQFLSYRNQTSALYECPVFFNNRPNFQIYSMCDVAHERALAQVTEKKNIDMVTIDNDSAKSAGDAWTTPYY